SNLYGLDFNSESLKLLEAFVPFKVESFKVDLDKLGDCTEVALQVVSTLALRAIPCMKRMAVCANFRPLKTNNLDVTAVALLGYQYMQKVVNNQRCLLQTFKDGHNAVAPHINKIIKMNCVPFSF
ncbi:hypothetical protein KR084_008908, partial [Drosophila pseudotakahashii]